MPNYQEQLEQKRKKAAQLQVEIKQLEARASAAARKERTGKLVAWGVAIEQLLNDGTLQPDWWQKQCHRVLTGRTLERAVLHTINPHH
jgi:hypothetical protein